MKLKTKNFSGWQKVERDAEDMILSGKLFQTFGAATGNALVPTVCKRTEGTARHTMECWNRVEFAQYGQEMKCTYCTTAQITNTRG